MKKLFVCFLFILLFIGNNNVFAGESNIILDKFPELKERNDSLKIYDDIYFGMSKIELNSVGVNYWNNWDYMTKKLTIGSHNYTFYAILNENILYSSLIESNKHYTASYFNTKLKEQWGEIKDILNSQYSEYLVSSNSYPEFTVDSEVTNVWVIGNKRIILGIFVNNFEYNISVLITYVPIEEYLNSLKAKENKEVINKSASKF